MKPSLVVAAALMLMAGVPSHVGSAMAQDEAAPPNAVESDQPRAGPVPSNVAESVTTQAQGSIVDAQEVIPMAPRVDNAVNNPPVDQAAHD
jgi:hypothetical protein